MVHTIRVDPGHRRNTRYESRAHRDRRGFTLIELLAVTAIMVLLSGVILAGNDRFGGQVQLQSLAYDVALSIRQAQVYGTGVQKVGPATTYLTGYGMRFDTSSPFSYTFFADLNSNGLYDTGASPSELVQTTSITGDYRVKQLCTRAAGSATLDCTATRLEVLFKRPDPDARISRNGTSCTATGACMDSGSVILESPRNDTATVTVWNNGQISVEK